MSLKVIAGPQRRRGPALEAVLLDAAWAELAERGYDDLTIDAVAGRAGTSRAVLYRRWPNKQELVLAALAHEATKDAVVVSDTGSLRGDVIALLQQANKIRVGTVTLLLTRLGGFYRQTGASLDDLRAFVQGGRDALMDEIIQRAIDRGEIQAEQVTERIAHLPVDLFRHELVMTLQPLTDEAIEEIVDTIFLPLLEARRPKTP
ncbi:MAG TPA: TetR/AcrR family transcriptional regulator [Mycobacterium sp.]